MVSCVVPQGSFGWFWKLLPTTDLKGKSDRVFENKASSTISTARLQSLSRLQTISPCPLRLFRGNPSGDELGEQGVTRILLFGIPKLPLPAKWNIQLGILPAFRLTDDTDLSYPSRVQPELPAHADRKIQHRSFVGKSNLSYPQI
ncbi:hypothetical protein ACQRIU_002595 [Beauveria bassiana]